MENKNWILYMLLEDSHALHEENSIPNMMEQATTYKLAQASLCLCSQQHSCG